MKKMEYSSFSDSFKCFVDVIKCQLISFLSGARESFFLLFGRYICRSYQLLSFVPNQRFSCCYLFFRDIFLCFFVKFSRRFVSAFRSHRPFCHHQHFFFFHPLLFHALQDFYQHKISGNYFCGLNYVYYDLQTIFFLSYVFCHFIAACVSFTSLLILRFSFHFVPTNDEHQKHSNCRSL